MLGDDPTGRPRLVRLRQRVGAAITDNFFRGASLLGRMHPKARPERHGLEVHRNLAYRAGGEAHLLDVYRPIERNGPLPVVLYVHGGGFRILSKDTHWVMALAFARAGFVVVNINYRLAPRHPFPAAVEDCCAALRWVAENAESFGGDLNRLVFAGESAGGNLVSSLTLATCFRRAEPFARAAFDLGVVPRAWMPYCAVLQVSNVGRFRQRWPHMSPFIQDRLLEVTNAYIGHDPRRHGTMLDLADPLSVLERGDEPDRPLPACFVTCGTKDPLVGDSQRLERALAARGVSHEARYYPGEPHAFHALVWTRNARLCWRDTYQFLDRFVVGPEGANRGIETRAS
jgi:acetyl esterase